MSIARAKTVLRSAGVGILFAVVVSAGFWWAMSEPPSLAPRYSVPAPSGVVIVLVDTLRADHLSCYGYERETTPRIDALAEEAVLFENAYSNSNWTKPAVASLFTGLWPGETGAVRLYAAAGTEEDAGAESSLCGSVATLAEVLGESGYRTAGFVNNPHVAAELGFGRGFDTYRQGAMSCDEIVERFLAWQEGLEASGAFFGYLHFLEPHGPYEPRVPFDGMFGDQTGASYVFDGERPDYERWGDYRDAVNTGKVVPHGSAIEAFKNLYDGEVRWCDEAIGRFLDTLKERGLYEETLVVVMADHGENFYEHKTLAHPTDIFYEPQIRMPLVIKFPRSWAIGPERLGFLVQTMDITATITKAASGHVLGRGRDLVDACATGFVPAAAVATEAADHCVVRFGDLKAWFRVASDGLKVVRIFDITDDPQELVNLLPDKPSFSAIAEKKASKWHAFVAGRGKANTAGDAPVAPSEERIEQLKAMGYI